MSKTLQREGGIFPLAQHPTGVPVRHCEHCGAVIPFRPRMMPAKYRTRKYCSLSCTRAALNKQEAKARRLAAVPTKRCENCGADIPFDKYVNSPSRFAKVRFCSVACSIPSRAAARQRPQEVECATCGKTYVLRRCEAARSVNHFCSPECHANFRAEERTCTTCGKSFRARAYKKGHSGRAFCSVECTRNQPRQKIVQYQCPVCGKDCEKFVSKMASWSEHYCSRRCQGIARRNLNPRPRFGSAENAAFRRRVLLRDKRTCQLCGRKKALQVHHIVALHIRHQLGLCDENGVTLCVDCHVGVIHRGNTFMFPKGRLPRELALRLQPQLRVLRLIALRVAAEQA
jgi:5-methylcytosine-specific restriction endonuclease McrA